MMAPACAVALPQYATTANKISSNANESSVFEMESALDFDLLAEYLLEDVGAGGFDFSSPADVSPPTIPQQQAVSALPQDPGVVTPNGSTSFVDPLADVAAQLHHQQQPQQQQQFAHALPNNGDLAGEFSRVQQMIATQQAHSAAAPPPGVAPQYIQQQPAQPQIQPLIQPVAPMNVMAVRQLQRPPQVAQPQKPPVAAVARAYVATAPITQRAPPPFMPRKNVMPVPPMAQQPNKRPRLNNAVIPSAKGQSYSFASASGSNIPHAITGAIPPGESGQKSQAQLDRRRERNRILARRTRLRKKFFFESLQKDVADLQRENASLKSIVRSRLKPDDARVLLNQCNANEKLPSAIHAREIEATSSGAGIKELDKEDFSLIQSIQNSQQCFIITDPSLHDNPIVYASDDFLTLTGYSQEEVLGRNCRFLQGTETCQTKVAEIREAMKGGEDVNVTFVNYTSDGKPFWNSLFIAALRDADNNIVNFIGVIVKSGGPDPGDSEYGKVLK